MKMGKKEDKEGNLEMEEECGLGGEDVECNMEKGVSFNLQCFFQEDASQVPQLTR